MTIKILMKASVRDLSYMDVPSTLKRIITNQIAVAFFASLLFYFVFYNNKIKQ